MQSKIKYDFSARLWQHPSPGGWYFVSLPKAMSQEIRENFREQEQGWGRMKAQASKQSIKWDTAIWYDSKLKTYVLPVKAKIRNEVGLKRNDEISVSVLI